MSALYTEIIQDAYKHPVHRGDLPGHSHSFEDENPLCGDVLRVEMQVEGDRVRQARFTGRGCAISQASAELLLDRIEGEPVADALALERDDILEDLGMPDISPARLKCALLALKVVKGALYGLNQ